MLELPGQLDLGDLPRFADWVELSTLLDPDGTTSKADVTSVLTTAGLFGFAPEELFPGDENYDDAALLSDGEDTQRFVDDVWAEVSARSSLGDSAAYPLEIRADEVVRRASRWSDSPAFTMLLLVDLGRSYSGVEIALQADSHSSRLFEQIVLASHRQALGGPAARLGWPREPHYPTPIDERISLFAEELGLELVPSFKNELSPSDKDCGLDVAGRQVLAGSAIGSLVFLTQCACGANWTTKKGEPMPTFWMKIIQWEAQLVRAIAVPFRLVPPWDYRRTNSHFDAVILDRLRLVSFNPDESLGKGTRKSINNWCRPRIARLPVLS